MVEKVITDSINHYLGKGISRGAAIGIVCPLYYESKLNPGSQGVQHTENPGVLNPSGAYGIASWNGPRQKSLLNYANYRKLPASDLNVQLDFVLTEAANSYHKVWDAIQTPGITYQEFIPIFVAQYENPADHQKEINAALALAATLPDMFTQVEQPPSTPNLITIDLDLLAKALEVFLKTIEVGAVK